MKIFATKILPEISKEIFIQNKIQIEEWNNEEPISKEDLIEILPEFDGLIVMGTKIDEEILNSAKQLKAISLISVGFDNIDISTATKLGIPVSNTPEVLNEATAEIAFLLMQNVSRKAFFNYKLMLDGKPKSGFMENLGIDLNGKTIGIFGLGRIGFVMAEKCKNAFGMNVIYHNRSRIEKAENDLKAQYVSFDELLENSDVLSIHSALTPETEKLFGENAFQKMKKSSILINTSREKVVDELALIKALQSGEIWGAGLDVSDPEPMSSDNPLLQMSNVAVLPHIGSATWETRNAMGKLAAENMVLALNGEKMKTPINPEVYE